MYFWNLLGLLWTRKITLATAVYAVRVRPVAVAGRGGSFQVDPHDPNL